MTGRENLFSHRIALESIVAHQMKLQHGASQLIADDLFALAFDSLFTLHQPRLKFGKMCKFSMSCSRVENEKLFCEMLPAVFFLLDSFIFGVDFGYLDDEFSLSTQRGMNMRKCNKNKFAVASNNFLFLFQRQLDWNCFQIIFLVFFTQILIFFMKVLSRLLLHNSENMIK